MRHSPAGAREPSCSNVWRLLLFGVNMSCNIYNADCATVLRCMPDANIDLTITSPPYDNLRDYKGYTLDIESIIKNLYRVTKEGGTVVWIV